VCLICHYTIFMRFPIFNPADPVPNYLNEVCILSHTGITAIADTSVVCFTSSFNEISSIMHVIFKLCAYCRNFDFEYSYGHRGCVWSCSISLNTREAGITCVSGNTKCNTKPSWAKLIATLMFSIPVFQDSRLPVTSDYS